jgi:hypothetical protein
MGRYRSGMKIAGKRRVGEVPATLPPGEALRRAAVLQAQVDLLNPYPRPRGFVYRTRSRADYEQWRKAQSNPRLW